MVEQQLKKPDRRQVQYGNRVCIRPYSYDDSKFVIDGPDWRGYITAEGTEWHCGNTYGSLPMFDSFEEAEEALALFRLRGGQ